MNEFELQDKIIRSKSLSVRDRFIMIAMLKKVDWSTWSGQITQSYLNRYTGVSMSTIKAALKNLESMKWITRTTQRTGARNTPTIININVEHILKVHGVKMNGSNSTGENEPVKMNRSNSTGENEPVKMNYNTIDINNNNINNNNINNNNINNKEYVTRAEALEYTSKQSFNDLYNLLDDRRKVPLHVLNAIHKRNEIERRFNESDIVSTQLNEFERESIFDQFRKNEIKEDFEKYGHDSKIVKNWSN